MDEWLNKVHCGDSLELLKRIPSESIQCVTTSPPYWGLRDYGVEGQLGLEKTPEEYVTKMVEVFREVRRILMDDGTLWLNLGDSYATGAGKACSPGGGKQGERFLECGPSGYRGNHNPSQKHSMKQVPDSKSPNSNLPLYQPNRMPIEGLKPKDLIGIPWRVAFALQSDGWYLRSDIIWHKPNAMPESVTDRPTKAHEYIFLMSKSRRYYYDSEAIKSNGLLKKSGNKQHKYVNGQQLHRTKSGFLKISQNIYEKVNSRTVWTIPTSSFPEAHFATFPPNLIEPCILAGSRIGDVVLDPFMGAGTTGVVAGKLGRKWIGIEINQKYKEIAEERIKRETSQLNLFHGVN